MNTNEHEYQKNYLTTKKHKKDSRERVRTTNEHEWTRMEKEGFNHEKHEKHERDGRRE